MVENWRGVVQVAAINCNEQTNIALCRQHDIGAYPTIKVHPYSMVIFSRFLSRTVRDFIYFQYFPYQSQNASSGIKPSKLDKYNLLSLENYLLGQVNDDWTKRRPDSWPHLQAQSELVYLFSYWICIGCNMLILELLIRFRLLVISN